MENRIIELGFTPYGCSPDKTYYKYQIADMSMYKNHPDGLNTYCSIYVSEILLSEIDKNKSSSYDRDIYLIELVSGRNVVSLIDQVSKKTILTSYFNPDNSNEIIPINKVKRTFIVEVISKRVKDYFTEATTLKPSKKKPKLLNVETVKELLLKKQVKEAILLIEKTYRPYTSLDPNGESEMEIWLNTMLMGHLAATGEFIEMVEHFNKVISEKRAA